MLLVVGLRVVRVMVQLLLVLWRLLVLRTVMMMMVVVLRVELLPGGLAHGRTVQLVIGRARGHAPGCHLFRLVRVVVVVLLLL